LGSEGRSTSTTVLTHAVLRRLEDHGFEPGDQKVLSFTDNRQDAALQAGHFNDSLKVARLRSAIYHALVKNRLLDFRSLDQAVIETLGLAPGEYARNPAGRFPGAIRDNENALKAYVMYLALHDLRRGWRVVLPNLEQCGLLVIDYRHLEENCASDESWRGVPFIEALSREERAVTIHHILDFFRKSYALASEEWLTQNAIDQKSKTIKEKLKWPWTFDENEKIIAPLRMGWEPLQRGPRFFWKSVGPASALGRWLKEQARQKGTPLDRKGYLAFIPLLLGRMAEAGWLKETFGKNRENKETPLYQLRVDQIVWKIGDGKTVTPDVVRIRSYKPYELQPNAFYRDLYSSDFRTRKKLIGEEHTGQLGHDDRIEREDKFKSGEYSALFCSPTMELGVDIADLNVVHMRNAPPNPSNYAQRSGRVGRSGQAALIFTSCSVYSPHDSHYFKHASDMVSGVVVPPRIDLSNQELLKSHLHAVYLAKVNLHEMNKSLVDLVDKEETLPLSPGVKAQLALTRAARAEIKKIFKKVVDGGDFRESGAMSWLNDEWIDRAIHAAPNAFDRALDRWRNSYISARNQLAEANRINESSLYKGAAEKKKVLNDVRQASNRRDSLENKDFRGSMSEFYPYRYLAAEGFLPGYNFTRLPIRAYIPVGDSGEYISRPRFIALREFGPCNIIYHKGAKYQIGQLQVQEAETRLKTAKVSATSGYILMDEQYDYEVCPFSGVALDGGATREIITDLMEMDESRTRRMDRISCEEEERLSRGFDIATYFS
ncbi:MAG: DEAD/DEAH box helicase, partial [Desulfobacterales bacterium]|nr:DEAD/DEAH box helicase [Desulfobacterales bacterium]